MPSKSAAKRAETPQPWGTYVLVLLCVIGLTYANNLESGVQSSADAAVQQAAAYWTERPYLEPADIIVEKLGAEAIQSRRAEFQREKAGKGAIGVPKAVRGHYQETLDELTAKALEPLTQLPRYRMGVRVSEPDGISYLSYAFLHNSWLHLIGNALLLLILGSYIERVWGHAVFGVFALVSSLAAATVFRVGNPELNAALIGTSGMIAGLLAAYTLRFASRWADPSYGAVIVGSLCWLMLPASFGWNASVVSGPTIGGEPMEAATASFWAIAGGLGCGLVVAAMMMFGKIESILFNADPELERKPSVDPDLEVALQAHADGRTDEAFELISALLQRKPEYRAALLAMWEVALDLGRPVDASNAMLRVIRDEVRRNAPSAVEHWLDLAGRGLHGDAEPALLIHVALMLSEADRRNEALSALQRAMQIAAETDSPEIAARVARASRSLDSRFTEAAAWRALGSPELSFKDRQNLEALLGELYRESPILPPERVPLDELDASATPAAFSQHADPDGRAEDPLLRWEDPELPDETGLPRDEPLTPVEPARDGSTDAARAASVRPAPIDLEITSRRLRVVRAQPTELGDDGLVIEIEGGSKRKIGFDRVDAVSVVAIDGIGPKFVIVVDLVLNWMSEPSEPLKVVRMRGDQFDPRAFAHGKDSPLDAMRSFTAQLLSRSNATPLPDVRSVQGTPFASFEDLAGYHRTVLSVEEEGADDGPAG